MSSGTSLGAMFGLLGVGVINSEILALVFYLLTGNPGAIIMVALPAVLFGIAIAIKIYEIPSSVRQAMCDGQTEYREGIVIYTYTL